MDHFRNWFLRNWYDLNLRKRQIYVFQFYLLDYLNSFFSRCFRPLSNQFHILCVWYCVIIKLDRYYDLSFQINMSKNIIQINGTQQTVTKLDIKRTNGAMVSFQSSNNCQTLKQNSTCFFFPLNFCLGTKPTGLLINNISEL